MTVYVKEFQVPCGVLLIGSCEGNLVMSDWRGGWHCASVQKRLERYFKGPFVEGTSPVIEEAQKELAEYFEGKRRTFDLPLAFAGTDFQKSVWQALQKIGYGETVSYLRPCGPWALRSAKTRFPSSFPATGLWVLTAASRATAEVLRQRSFFWVWNQESINIKSYECSCCFWT